MTQTNIYHQIAKVELVMVKLSRRKKIWAKIGNSWMKCLYGRLTSSIGMAVKVEIEWERKIEEKNI